MASLERSDGPAACLQSIGYLDWEAEYEAIVNEVENKAKRHFSDAHLAPQVSDPARNVADDEEASQLCAKAASSHSDDEASRPCDEAINSPTSDGSTDTDQEIQPSTILDAGNAQYEDISQYGDEPADAPIVAAEAEAVDESTQRWRHPGWTWIESPSWHPEWTATSPEVAIWALTPDLGQEAVWIIRAAGFGADYAHNDIPRLASILRRAYREVYPVPLNAGLMFPPLARGYKPYYRMATNAPKQMFRRGCKGLKSALDPEIRTFVEYAPAGANTRSSNNSANGDRNFYPQPSRLSMVMNSSDFEAAEANEVVEVGKIDEELDIPFLEGLETESFYGPRSAYDGDVSDDSDSSSDTSSHDGDFIKEKETGPVIKSEEAEEIPQSGVNRNEVAGSTDAPSNSTSEAAILDNRGAEIAQNVGILSDSDDQNICSTEDYSTEDQDFHTSATEDSDDVFETCAAPPGSNDTVQESQRNDEVMTQSTLLGQNSLHARSAVGSPPANSAGEILRDAKSAKKRAPVKTLYEVFLQEYGVSGQKAADRPPNWWSRLFSAALSVILRPFQRIWTRRGSKNVLWWRKVD